MSMLGFVSSGDSIDLGALAFSAGGTTTITAGAFLVVSVGAVNETLALGGAKLSSTTSVRLSNDGAGGTLVTIACFHEGTLIATPTGEAPVEMMRRGTRALLADGRVATVRWLGVQTMSGGLADPLRVAPIRVRAGALGPGRPRRDLLLSPCHALWLDGLLVQAGALVGCPGITRESTTAAAFRYYHLELDDHALLLAEGVAAESYLPAAGEFAFDNRADRPEGGAATALPYPRVKAARQLPAALRQRFAA
jgi:hypothetical protein